MKDVLDKWGMAPIELITDPEVKPNMLKVYIALSSFNEASRECDPSREDISERAKIHVREVSASITALVKAGWVVRTQRGLGLSNVYRVLFSKSKGGTE